MYVYVNSMFSYLSFSVVLLIKNRNLMVEYWVSVILRVETVLYTGRVGDPVKRLNIDRLVRPGVLEEIRLDVSWEEYGPRLLDQCAFNIACLATVKDTNFEYFAQDDFRVRKPDIKITVNIKDGLKFSGQNEGIMYASNINLLCLL